MKLALVDDEIEAVRTLEEIISSVSAEMGFSCHIDSFTDSRSFLSALYKNNYPIVFLDIYIDDMDGMDLAGEIRKISDSTMIIFCTTSRENMPEAFRFHAFDYVVKPVTEGRIRSLFEDAMKVMRTANRYMSFTANRKEIHLLFSDCLWSMSEGHYLHIKSRSGEEYQSRMTTKEFLTMTDSDRRFLSINKGIVVNMDHVKTIENGSCTMTDGSAFPIKVRQSARIKQEWQNYIFDSLREGQR